MDSWLFLLFILDSFVPGFEQTHKMDQLLLSFFHVFVSFVPKVVDFLREPRLHVISLGNFLICHADFAHFLPFKFKESTASRE